MFCCCHNSQQIVEHEIRRTGAAVVLHQSYDCAAAKAGVLYQCEKTASFRPLGSLHCLARQLIVQLIVLQKRLEGDLIVGTRTVAINIFSLLQPLFGLISTFCRSHVIFHFNQHFVVIFLKRLMISGFICDISFMLE